MKLNPETGVPLYQQIFVILRNKIYSGELSVGERLQSEQELCVQFGVSRITARRALSKLAESGLVERQRGSGTRVAAQANAHRPVMASMDGLIENVGHIGRTTDVRVLEHGLVPASGEASAALDLQPGTTVQRAIRVRSQGATPMTFLVTWIPTDVAHLIEGQDMSSTPLLILLEDAGVSVDSAHQTISATIADSEVATALGIAAGSPLIEVRRIVSSSSGRPIEYIKVLYRPEFYRFEMNMRRVEHAEGRAWSSDQSVTLAEPPYLEDERAAG
ncbi:MAG: GntR family transcriptional regulator [Pseudomonadota bacterium]